MSKSFRKVEHKTWTEAREEIAWLEIENPPYFRVDFYSYKDGSGYAIYESDEDWAIVRVEWSATHICTPECNPGNCEVQHAQHFAIPEG